MTWVVKRYIPLVAGSTLFDPDPASTQPGEFALDGSDVPIPTTTSRGGQVWGDVQVVNDAGVVQPPGAFVVTLGFAKRTASDNLAAAGSVPSRQFAWNRGALSVGQPPGIEQTQDGMEQPNTVALVVTGGTNTPATGRLAVRVWEGAR